MTDFPDIARQLLAGGNPIGTSSNAYTLAEWCAAAQYAVDTDDWSGMEWMWAVETDEPPYVPELTRAERNSLSPFWAMEYEARAAESYAPGMAA